jgi:glycosyltransferase involved in cell wall biosynthesis
LPEHFVLFLGTLEPRKNIPTLIRAFADAKKRAKLPHQLIIAGGRGWMDDAIPRTIEKMGMRREVRLAGFVPQSELRYWYQAADAFVYPSQYEGFGIPPLEALAAGTPVVTTNVSSLPEAVGNAALLVEPRNEQALADAIGRILNDSALRERLHAEGISRAREFTWTRAAELTAQTYRRALRGES